MANAHSTLRVSGLTRKKLATLHAQAKAAGMSADAYARVLLEDAIALHQQAKTSSFDVLLAPFRRRFRESGMTEAELDALVDAARKRHHRRTSRKKA